MSSFVKSRIQAFALAILLLPIVTAFLCNAGGGASDTDLQKLEAEIMELIGDANASGLQFCRVIAFGSKPCGGPWRYLVYSLEDTDSTLLKSKVDEYNTLQADINRQRGLVSDCSLAVPPSVSYTEGRCVAE